MFVNTARLEALKATGFGSVVRSGICEAPSCWSGSDRRTAVEVVVAPIEEGAFANA